MFRVRTKGGRGRMSGKYVWDETKHVYIRDIFLSGTGEIDWWVSGAIQMTHKAFRRIRLCGHIMVSYTLVYIFLK